MSNKLGIGEVKQCAHCDGNGVCKAGFGNMRSFLGGRARIVSWPRALGQGDVSRPG